jgi:hypothetical protein
MKSLVDILAWVVGAGTVAAAGWQLFSFLSYKDPATGAPDYGHVGHLWWAGLAALITIACIVTLFIRHPRVEEEIHVTK